MLTTVLRMISVVGFMGVVVIGAVQGREMQYNDYKAPMVDDTPAKSEPRPVYPPLKRKPYTRSTRLA